MDDDLIREFSSENNFIPRCWTEGFKEHEVSAEIIDAVRHIIWNRYILAYKKS